MTIMITKMMLTVIYEDNDDGENDDDDGDNDNGGGDNDDNDYSLQCFTT